MKKHNMEQRSDEWFQIRKGKITGTTLKAIMSSRADVRDGAFYEIIAQRLTKGIPEDENAMDRGNRLEGEALKVFEFETGKDVELLGFAEDDTNPFIANSPDGYIKDTKDTEALEIKCPGGKNYVKAWILNKVPDEYEWQVVQYFVVNPKLKKLWFALYNPDIPVHPFHCIEVLRESIADDITEAKEAQEEFLKKVEATLATIIEL